MEAGCQPLALLGARGDAPCGAARVSGAAASMCVNGGVQHMSPWL